MIDIFLYILTGAFAGLAAGLFGVGGGLVIVPVLHTVLLEQGHSADHVMHVAIATSLSIIITTSISSTYAHHKKSAVHWRIFAKLTPSIIVGTITGSLLASSLSNMTLTYTFVIFEFLVAVKLITAAKNTTHNPTLPLPAAISGGGIIGFISSIVGIGGGTMTVPFLHWFGSSMKHAVATSAAVGFPIAVSATFAYAYTGMNYQPNTTGITLGFIDLSAFFFIAVCSFVFAPVGAKLAHRISDNHLRYSFAALLIILGLTMILRAS